jgi:hypothetical protein
MFFALTFASAAAPAAEWKQKTAEFIQSLAREDGGFAFPDQAQSHLTTTFAALGTQRRLGVKAANPDRIAAFVRASHPQNWRKPDGRQHEFDLQQIQALLWLGQVPGDSFSQQAIGWTKPKPYNTRFESHGYPAFQQQMACLVARDLLKIGNDGIRDFQRYLDSRRRDNGSYNNNPPGDDGSDGHVLNTLWGIRGAGALKRPIEKKAELVRWLQSCQLPAGHFVYTPRPAFGGKSDDVVYTWAAVEALRLLDATPTDAPGCIRYLHSLYNADGGFGDRPGWPSNSISTYYAVETLATLGALSQEITRPAAPPPPASLPAGLKLFKIQIEAPGVGSALDAVEMARAMHVDLWGTKSAKLGWGERAQKIADERKVPVKFFVANEEYGTFFTIPGMGTYSHLADVIAPMGVDFGKSMANAEPVPTYGQFLEKRIAPLERANGRNVYQFNENECLERMMMDASLEAPGFAAISTFHFNNPDFIASSPYLWHFQFRVPLISLQDNHAAEPWFWGDQMDGFCTFFLAKEPTWAGWLEALKANRVVAVRHDEVSGGLLWIHGGDAPSRQRVMDEQDTWRWWRVHPSDPAPAIGRPMLSLVALTPADTGEAGAPKQGTALRIRRRWSNTASGGAPKAPTSELVSVSVDGSPVQPQRVTPGNEKGAADPPKKDEYYLVPLPDLPSGHHTATAAVKPLGDLPASNALSQTISFDVK